jgi:glyoxylase-like metal-dependent hydrolase (beta-lactamase superfamily II)
MRESIVKWTYRKGLHDLGHGAWAWLAPDGSWGWSNAGLVTDGEESLLVDTLFDLDLTRDMLKTMRDAAPKATINFDTLVNTHANGDHCHGNELVAGATIIASTASAEEMAELPPDALAAFVDMAGDLGPTGDYFLHCFGQFNFHGIDFTPPNKTFEGEMTVQVGDKPVHLIEVGPAHTRGDVLVWSPTDKTVFSGDILFIEGTPIMWQGPVENWIAACLRIEAMDVETIIPGHGPITDKAGVRAVRQYLEYVRDEARARYDNGMDAWQAAQDIDLAPFAGWLDSERIAVNVDTLYRQFNKDTQVTDIMELFRRMGELAGYH